jgi:hypothetical protein
MTNTTPRGLHGIFQTVVDGKIAVDNIANRKAIENWLHEDQGESLSTIGPEWFERILTPALKAQLVWTSADVLDQTKRNQIAEETAVETRKVFSEAARHFKTFSECEANFQHCCSVLGKSFSKVQFQQAYSFGSLAGLVSSSAEELEQWKQEQIAEENKILRRDATSQYEIQQQKQIAHNRRMEAAQMTAERRIQQDLVERFLREVKHGSKESGLPQQWLGKPLNPEFIKKASAETLRTLVRRFGTAQLDARLRGITQAAGLIDFGNGRGPVEVAIEFQ